MGYEEARASLERNAHEAHLFLAARSDVEPEILAYLASNETADVRRLVAANPTTPQHANKLLALDSDEDVRLALAHKMAGMFETHAGAMTERARVLAIEIGEMLARDSSARVRKAICATARPYC